MSGRTNLTGSARSQVEFPQRVESVEMLRGLASVAVMWFHLTMGFGGWIEASGAYGWLGVPIFFVISGFVIPLSMHRSAYTFPASVGPFLCRRVVRLEPPYLAAILLILVLLHVPPLIPGFAGKTPHFDMAGTLLHIGYLNPLFEKPWLNPVFWSLAIEFQFYLLMALIMPALSGPRRIVWLTAFCSCALLPLNEISVFHHTSLFTLGIATYWLRAGLVRRGAFLGMCAIATTTTYASLGPVHAAAALPVALLIAFVDVPRMGLLTILGTISYSLYLLHVPIGTRAVAYVHRYWESQALALLAGITMSMAVAYFFYKFVESPSQRAAKACR